MIEVGKCRDVEGGGILKSGILLFAKVFDLGEMSRRDTEREFLRYLLVKQIPFK